jgi:hypothetical protein
MRFLIRRMAININPCIHDRLMMCGGLRLRVKPAMTARNRNPRIQKNPSYNSLINRHNISLSEKKRQVTKKDFILFTVLKKIFTFAAQISHFFLLIKNRKDVLFHIISKKSEGVPDKSPAQISSAE